jgi:hypothetical protein
MATMVIAKEALGNGKTHQVLSRLSLIIVPWMVVPRQSSDDD